MVGTAAAHVKSVRVDNSYCKLWKQLSQSSDDINATSLNTTTSTESSTSLGSSGRRKKPLQATRCLVIPAKRSVTTCSRISHKGDRIAISGRDRDLSLYSVETGKQLTSPMRNHYGWILHLAWSPCDKYIVTGGDDRRCIVWDSENHTLINIMNRHSGTIYHTAWSGCSQFIASASGDKLCIVWKMHTVCRTSVQNIALKGHTQTVTAVSFHPFECGKVVTGSKDNSMMLWSVDKGLNNACPLVTIPQNASVVSVDFDSTGDQVLSATIDGKLRVWLLSGTCLFSISSDQPIRYACFVNNHPVIYSHKTISIWDPRQCELLDFLRTPSDLRCVDFLGDKLLVTHSSIGIELYSCVGLGDAHEMHLNEKEAHNRRMRQAFQQFLGLRHRMATEQLTAKEVLQLSRNFGEPVAASISRSSSTVSLIPPCPEDYPSAAHFVLADFWDAFGRSLKRGGLTRRMEKVPCILEPLPQR